MAEVAGKKIKELELVTTVSGKDDLLIDTTPDTGSPQTKRISVGKFKEEMNRELNSDLGGFQILTGRVFSREFASAPVVITCPASSAPGTAITGTSASDVTKSGCNIYLTRSGTTTSTVMWVAI